MTTEVSIKVVSPPEKVRSFYSKSYAYQILPTMEEVRAVADQIEVLLGEEYKPFPSNEDLLYSVQ